MEENRVVLIVELHREIPFSPDDLTVIKQFAEQMKCNYVKARYVDLNDIRLNHPTTPSE